MWLLSGLLSGLADNIMIGRRLADNTIIGILIVLLQHLHLRNSLSLLSGLADNIMIGRRLADNTIIGIRFLPAGIPGRASVSNRCLEVRFGSAKIIFLEYLQVGACIYGDQIYLPDDRKLILRNQRIVFQYQ